MRSACATVYTTLDELVSTRLLQLLITLMLEFSLQDLQPVPSFLLFAEKVPQFRPSGNDSFYETAARNSQPTFLIGWWCGHGPRERRTHTSLISFVEEGLKRRDIVRKCLFVTLLDFLCHHAMLL